jgi:quercetin dioxygenase-like cupin family protein
MSTLGDIRDLPLQQIWDGIAGRVLHGDALTLGLIELEPSIHLPEHRHPNEQLGMVIEGSITFTVGDETRELGPGETWRIPSDTPHTADVGPEGAVVIDVFAPPREDWKALPKLAPAPPRWPHEA